MTGSVYERKNNDSTLSLKEKDNHLLFCDNSLNSFLYALKSSGANKQCPASPIKLFDYLEIENIDIDKRDESTLKCILQQRSVIFFRKS